VDPSVKAVPSPDIAWFQNSPWVLDGLQTPERIQQDCPLLLYLKGLPEGMAKGVTKVEGPGGLDLRCDLLLEGDAYGGNSLGLDRPLHQAHGLVAQTSGGRENNGLGPVSD
jgi:hypothetical protein